MRIAMWSGPRNLSTAMMYSFGARDDFAVVDEPFYATYLEKTGLDHPMRDEVIASQKTDEFAVVDDLLGPISEGKPHFYQKHMCQHMLPDIPRDWISAVENVFLLRHPARVIASFSKKYADLTLADIGFTQQSELFDQLVADGKRPIVIDSFDIRQNPEGMLRALCDALGLDWDPAMLSWPTGGHPADGVWAKVWYDAVHNSTGFAGAEGPLPAVQAEHEVLLEQAIPHHERLERLKIRL